MAQSLYVHVPEWERKVLRWIYSHRDYFWATRCLQRVVSTRPSQDICVYTNAFAILGLVLFGRPVFWTLSTAYICLLGMPQLVPVKTPRPSTLEQHVLPLARTSEDLVCADCFSAAVVALLFVLRTSNAVAGTAFLVLALILAATRIVACSKFVHQVVGGLALGAVVVAFTHQWPEHLCLSVRQEWIAIGLITTAVTVRTLLQIENNEHPYLGIPRKEYLRVLNNIMMQDTTNVDPHLKQKDSFVLMINQMHRRELRRRARRQREESS